MKKKLNKDWTVGLNYNWKKTALKAVWSLGFVLSAGLVAIITDNPKYMLIIPLFEAARNYAKHKLGWL